MSNELLRKIALEILLILLGTLGVAAQGISLSGVVYEEQKGNPLVGATVIMLNDNNRVISGTVTDIDGNFKVLVPEGVTKLSFSFIGLKTVTLPVEKGKRYEIILKSDQKMLGEVVVSAKREVQADYGMISRSKKDLANAVSSVDIKVLETQSVSTVDQLLQGAAPGLMINFNSGDPGAGASVQIRGTNSLEGGSKPLWVIDGVEMLGDDYNTSDLNNFGSNPIAGIDPADIESIDVLKDAGATSIYGSRGANGVIVIRTKRGRKGKPQLSASASWIARLKPERIPMLTGDQQRIFTIESYTGTALENQLDRLKGNLDRPDAWIFNNNVDMMDMITQVGFDQKYSVNLQGGGDRLSYYWSVGFNTSYGTTIGGGFNRLSTMLNLDYRISDKLKVSSKFSYNNTLTDKRCTQWPVKGLNYLDGTYLHPRQAAYSRAAFLPVYTKNGGGFYVEDGGGGAYLDIMPIRTRMEHSLAMMDNSIFETRDNQFTAQFVLDFNILSNLNFNTQASVDYKEGGTEFFASSMAFGVYEHIPDYYNRGQRKNAYDLNLVNKNRIVWKPVNTESHYLGITGIADIIYRLNGDTFVDYTGSGSPDLTESSSATKIVTASGSETVNTSVSFVIDMHYRLLNRFNFQLALKSEGNSNIGKEDRFPVYPTASFSWRLENEPLLQDVEWIEALKPRFSWGQSGNLPGGSDRFSVTYGNGLHGYLDKPFTYINGFAQDQLSPERVNEYNYGIDWELFKGRISGEFSYYSRHSKGLLLSEAMSSATGSADLNRRSNCAELKNYGFEVGLNLVPIAIENGLRWNVYFSASRNRQKITDLPERWMESDANEGNLDYGFKGKLQKGSVKGAFYGYKALGVYATDDDAVVHDFNGNIVYDANGIPRKMRYDNSNGTEFGGGDMIYEDVNKDGVINHHDLVQVGDANIDLFGMFRHNLTWKNLSLGVSFYYSIGQDAVNGVRYDLENMEGTRNQATSTLRRWRKQGDVTDMPRAGLKRSINYLPSTRWVEDASFIKLKEISLTYNFPARLLKPLRLKQLSVWVTAMDLWCGTKYKGINPEIGPTEYGSGKFKLALDKNNTPPSAQISGGIRVTF